MSTNQNLMQHMRELIDRIKAADVAYYRDDNPTMTDREYDLLVDELKELETTTGLILSGSPTQTVPGEILKELMPVRHTKPMLSADKTKSVDEMLRFANGRPVVLSWKLDGLTIVLRYEGGEFKQAITRGREGIIGEDVTHTVRTFMNVPMCIPCTDKFEVRGEGVISWAHFEKINLSLSEPYSHPRNLAAGSVRMLDARESGKRYLEFFAFDLISDSIEEQSKTAQLQFLAENGFDVVPYVYTDAHDADELRKLIADFKPAEYVHIYIAVDEFLELCRKLDCGELRYMLQSKKKNGDNTPLYQCLGGTSAEKLRAIGRARPDGKSLSRVAQLVPANKADFLFVADSGPGETNEKGLIVPKFGNKPENHVAVMMSFESLSEMFLITRMHYQCWLASWYQQNLSQPAQKQGQYSENHKEPDSSSVQMF